MAAALTSAEFIERLRQSGVCAESRLDPYVKRQKSSATARAEPIAAEMVDAGLLTEFQSRQILCGKHEDLLIAGKYRILELLGRGGMSSVFLCEHLRMRRLVAVKVLPADRNCDQATLARFDREAQAVAALDHPNIVRAFDIDQADGRHFLVMEFIDGIDLHTLVAKHGKLDIAQAAWCIVQTARGLQHAWQSGWVHRDIKPGNLLLDRGGTIKILDMGLARIFNHAGSTISSLFKEEVVLGTVDFVSPEQAAGASETDIRADIYSLGASFYYLLTGRAPFEDGSLSQKLLWHRTLMPLPVHARRPDVPESLADIVVCMMAKDPSQRYATPLEVADALLPYCSDTPPLIGEVMPRWNQAVAARIRGSSPSNELTAPITEQLAVKHAPETGEVRPGDTSVTNPQLLRLGDRSSITLPRWLAGAVLLLLIGLIGWTVYRETNLLGHSKAASPAPTVTINQ